jgi:hypothetical protein
LTHEQRVESFHIAGDIVVPTVNVAQHNTTNTGKFQKNYSHQYGQSSSRGRGRGRVHGIPQSFQSSSTNHPICQICNSIGHQASKCYNRFDYSYHNESPNPAAYLTTPHSQPDFNWYPDTGSTHHLTNDLSNLNLRANEYKGTDQIEVGNGQGLNILHTELAQILSSHQKFS